MSAFVFSLLVFLSDLGFCLGRCGRDFGSEFFVTGEFNQHRHGKFGECFFL